MCSEKCAHRQQNSPNFVRSQWTKYCPLSVDKVQKQYKETEGFVNRNESVKKNFGMGNVLFNIC